MGTKLVTAIVNGQGNLECPLCQSETLEMFEQPPALGTVMCLHCNHMVQITAREMSELIRIRLHQCELCALRSYATNPVPSEGDLKSRIGLLGRNPGSTEDRIGQPFVGQAGQKLNHGLLLANLRRNSCRVMNVGKCLTPPNISPPKECLEICSTQWLQQEFQAMLNLELVIVLGNEALQYFEPDARVGQLHGMDWMADCPWPESVNTKIKIFCSYHPAAALRNVVFGRKFVDDMKKLGNLLKQMSLV